MSPLKEFVKEVRNYLCKINQILGKGTITDNEASSGIVFSGNGTEDSPLSAEVNILPYSTGTWSPAMLAGFGNTNWSIQGFTKATWIKIGKLLFLTAQISLIRNTTGDSSVSIYISESSLPYPTDVDIGGVYSVLNTATTNTVVTNNNNGLQFASSSFGASPAGTVLTIAFTLTYTTAT